MTGERSERDPVEQLAEDFVARYRRGERPSVSEYARRYPELADQISDFLQALVAIEEFGPGQDAPPHWEPGPRLLGEYRLLREVGRGGMGVVYEAEQVSLSRRVAVKVLPPDPLRGPTQSERFRREAQAAAKLHHTNIVPVYGVGEVGGVSYYAMQFIDGRPLDEVLQEVKRLRDAAGPAGLGSNAPPEPTGSPSTATLLGLSDATGRTDGRYYSRRVAQIGAEVADALAYAHAQGVVHRDVKPSNLLLDARGAVWVTDFGLAKAEGVGGLTQAGDVVGTLRYMAPERFDGRSDPRSDVYSLGLTLYELLTLRPAFEESDRGRLVTRVLREEPRRPRKIDPLIPRDLETIVLKSTAKEPNRRYQSAAEMAEDLRRYVDGRPVVARPIGLTERAVKWARRHPAAAAAYGLLGLAVLLGAIAAGAFGLWRDADRARAEAVTARDEAAALRTDLERLNGIRQVDLAHRDWLGGDLAAGLGRLERAALSPSKGWEWDYVYHLYHGGFRNLEVPDRGLAQGATLSPDGRFLAVRWGPRPGASHEVLVWDHATPSARPAALLRAAARVTACTFHPDGAMVYLGTAAGTVELWEASTGNRLDVRTLQDHPVLGLAVGLGGRTIATSGLKDQRVKLWDWSDGRELKQFEAVAGLLGAFAFTSDWSRLAAPARGDRVKVWDTRSGAELLTLAGLPVVDDLEFDPTGRLLAGTAHDGTKIWVRDAGTGREMFEHRQVVQTLATFFDADGRLVATDGPMVRSWDVRSGRPGRTFRGPTGPGTLLAVGGRRVAAIATFREPFVWDVDEDLERSSFIYGRRPHGLAVRPGAGGLAICARDRRIQLHNPATGQLVRTFADHPADDRVLTASPDGGLLAVGCADGTVRVWDTDTGRLVAERRWPSDGVSALVFSRTAGSWPRPAPITSSASGSRVAGPSYASGRTCPRGRPPWPSARTAGSCQRRAGVSSSPNWIAGSTTVRFGCSTSSPERR